MQIVRRIEPTFRLMGKLEHGADLLAALTRICREHDIRLGRVEAIGAVSKACIGYYDQAGREYRFMELDRPLEILKLAGNVSVRDGSPMVHAHVTLGEENGQAIGGHLANGTTVFACEFAVEAFAGEDLVRGFDETTGLPLWQQ
jgi:hypothetical protein